MREYIIADNQDISKAGMMFLLSRQKDELGCPDVIFIFGATNDCWAGAPLGEYKYGGWTKEDSPEQTN